MPTGELGGAGSGVQTPPPQISSSESEPVRGSIRSARVSEGPAPTAGARSVTSSAPPAGGHPSGVTSKVRVTRRPPSAAPSPAGQPNERPGYGVVIGAPEAVSRRSRSPQLPSPCQRRTLMRFTPGARTAGASSEQSPAAPRQACTSCTFRSFTHTWSESSLEVQSRTRSGAPVPFSTAVASTAIASAAPTGSPDRASSARAAAMRSTRSAEGRPSSARQVQAGVSPGPSQAPEAARRKSMGAGSPAAGWIAAMSRGQIQLESAASPGSHPREFPRGPRRSQEPLWIQPAGAWAEAGEARAARTASARTAAARARTPGAPPLPVRISSSLARARHRRRARGCLTPFSTRPARGSRPTAPRTAHAGGGAARARGPRLL